MLTIGLGFLLSAIPYYQHTIGEAKTIKSQIALLDGKSGNSVKLSPSKQMVNIPAVSVCLTDIKKCGNNKKSNNSVSNKLVCSTEEHPF